MLFHVDLLVKRNDLASTQTLASNSCSSAPILWEVKSHRLSCWTMSTCCPGLRIIPNLGVHSTIGMTVANDPLC